MHRKLTLRRPAAVLATAALWLVAVGTVAADPPDRFDPAIVDRTLQAGQSTTVDKTLHLTGLPALADIIIAIDTTSSMGLAVTQAQVEASQIFADVKAAIPGARFAVVDFEDYPGMPSGSAADVAYTLTTPLGFSGDLVTFEAGLAGMAPDAGGDIPEAYNRVNFEAISDPVLTSTRNPNATQFLVVLGDAVPHSASAFGACPAAPPDDFGRDNAAGGGDDLNTLLTLLGLDANNITLLMMRYGSSSTVLACYEDMADFTGGDAVPSGGAGAISAFIIANAAATPYTVGLAVSPGCPIGFSFSPAPPYGPFTGPSHPTFTETITAPTTPGNYTCTINAVMTPGGATAAVETVNVNVTPGPPATLTLTPPNDTNTVGDTHCVTATVRDSFGNPVPGVVVNFTVSGANTNGGAGVTGANGQAQLCYVGTVAGNDTITANAAGLTATAQKTWRAGAPASLVLTPATDTNTVDDQHCVTATVRDQFGNATPGITVRFSVTGSVTTSGSATTNAVGQAQFCYTGPGLPGADVITAYADTNNNNVRSADEPQGTAAKTWVIPASTEGCKVTNGGWIIAANGDRANFGGNAKATGPSGNENYQDKGPATDIHVKSTEVLAVTCSTDGTSASIFGTAEINGAGSFDFRIDVRDLGEPGSTDRYRLRLSNGYDSGDQQLSGGNIQIH